MNVTSSPEHEALSHANGNAAIDAALALLNTDKEAVRAAHWNRLDERTRKMVCALAGVDPKKGCGALRNLDALERGKINLAARRLMRDIDILMKCAQGGAMPAGATLAGHSFDGIAAAGVVQ